MMKIVFNRDGEKTKFTNVPADVFYAVEQLMESFMVNRQEIKKSEIIEAEIEGR